MCSPLSPVCYPLSPVCYSLCPVCYPLPPVCYLLHLVWHPLGLHLTSSGDLIRRQTQADRNTAPWLLIWLVRPLIMVISVAFYLPLISQCLCNIVIWIQCEWFMYTLPSAGMLNKLLSDSPWPVPFTRNFTVSNTTSINIRWPILLLKHFREHYVKSVCTFNLHCSENRLSQSLGLSFTL